MSTVPYIFADDYGNIPLSYLDANFANVKANVDYATSAGSATTALTAGTVTTNAQPNITSVGTLSSLSVTGATSAGNITASGNVTIAGITSVGNVSAGNITASGNVTITGTLTAGNIKYTSNVFVGDLKGSVYADDSTIMVDAVDNSISADTASIGSLTVSGNTSSGNVSTGALSATGNTSVGNITVSNRIVNDGLEIVFAAINGVVANATTSNLSPTTTYNIIYGNAPGFTHTLNMPADPVNGQLTKFSIAGNAIILVEGTGTLNVGFAGNAAVGNAYAYMYRSIGNQWVKTA